MNFLSTTITKKRRVNVRLPFSKDEDQKLITIIENSLQTNFEQINSKIEAKINWKNVSKEMGSRTSRQCKERYIHYLSPKINKSDWTSEEDSQLLLDVNHYGKRWKILENKFKDRTEIDIRNRFNVLQRRISKVARKNFSNYNMGFRITNNTMQLKTKNVNDSKTHSNGKNDLKFDKNAGPPIIKNELKPENDPFEYLFDFSNETSDENQKIDDDDPNMTDLYQNCVFDPIFFM